MSTDVFTRTLITSIPDGRRRHRLRLWVGALLAVALVLGLVVYGADYYLLDAAGRAMSSKHSLLRPSGTIGLKLGMLGTLLFFGLYLYPIRKRWPWLAKKGNTKHWLDVHILLGLLAPVVIAFHASFKFHGVAGVAFWIMLAVALSGIAGRYLYAQIPRSLTAAEISQKELQEQQQELARALESQKLVSARDLSTVLELPSAERVRAMPVVTALLTMVLLDLRRSLRISALRARVAGGWLRPSNPRLEEVIRTARRQAALAKRVLFLTRAQQVFHLWHVVHRPFSYSFSVLALVHILVVMLFGVL